MNLLGAWRVTRAFLPLLRKSGHGRIVNTSSEHGSFGGAQGMSALEDSVAAYGISKAALNASSNMPLSAGLLFESTSQAITFDSNDKMEGTSAFLEKRKPSFTGE